MVVRMNLRMSFAFQVRDVQPGEGFLAIRKKLLLLGFGIRLALLPAFRAERASRGFRSRILSRHQNGGCWT